jgi:hypothetical protein
MSVPTDAVSWIGGLATLAAGGVYAYMSMYFRQQSKYRLPLWLLVPAFVFAVQQFGQLRDVGTYPRIDGINYNYFRQVAFTVSDLFAGVAIAAYLWHDIANGWTIILYGVAASTLTTLSGLPSDDGRFPLSAIGIAFRVLQIVYLVWRTWINRNPKLVEHRHQLPDGPEATGGRRFALFVCIGGYIGCQTVNQLVHLLSWDMTRQIFYQLTQWINLGMVLGVVFLPFIAAIYHQPIDTVKGD